jgi:hypothetical protein
MLLKDFLVTNLNNQKNNLVKLYQYQKVYHLISKLEDLILIKFLTVGNKYLVL